MSQNAFWGFLAASQKNVQKMFGHVLVLGLALDILPAPTPAPRHFPDIFWTFFWQAARKPQKAFWDMFFEFFNNFSF